MQDKEKQQLNMKVQWAKFIAVTVLYLIFLFWVKSFWGLLVVPFIFDVIQNARYVSSCHGLMRWFLR